jgi:pyridoxal 5'-phosphate synthase pdxT subunit
MTGVLAVQGDFREHEKALSEAGEEWFEIRSSKDLEKPFDRLVFPGGESTVQSRLIRELNLFAGLKAAIDSGIPVFATCAGMILLSDRCGGSEGCCFRTLPVNVRRNAYGRQLGSFFTEDTFRGIGTVPMEFIRAPYIESAGEGVEIKSVTGGHITGVRYKNQLAVSFHPELTGDVRIYRYWLGAD